MRLRATTHSNERELSLHTHPTHTQHTHPEHTHTHPALEALPREETDLGRTEDHEGDDRGVVVAEHLAPHLDQRATEVVAVLFNLLKLLLAFVWMCIYQEINGEGVCLQVGAAPQLTHEVNTAR